MIQVEELRSAHSAITSISRPAFDRQIGGIAVHRKTYRRVQPTTAVNKQGASVALNWNVRLTLR
jgi:hypothetical protein